MIYHTQEVVFDLPEQITDRSVNVLFFGEASAPTLNIVLSRDTIAESLENMVEQQQKIISASYQNFKEITPPEPIVLPGNKEAKAISTNVSFKDKGMHFHQKQVFVEIPGGKLVVFVGTHPGPWGEPQHKVWQHVIGTVRLRN